ncbi:unnamed protein product [Rhizophagus irregularis]|nr:unnamed protein product [Rhizophagus irregularis]
MDITSELLKEIESYTVINSYPVARCFGITKDPVSNNFMMVMQYAKDAEELHDLLAVYTSRLLDFKNLPEPKNAVDNKDDDNSIGGYSESIEAIDFTNLNLGTDL